MNYIRCDDLPIVFTKVMTVDGQTVLSYNNGEEKLTYPFHPDRVCMQPLSGRVYHPGPDRGGGVGLVKSNIAIDWSPYFLYKSTVSGEDCPPTHFVWQGTEYKLSNDLFPLINQYSSLEKQT